MSSISLKAAIIALAVLTTAACGGASSNSVAATTSTGGTQVASPAPVSPGAASPGALSAGGVSAAAGGPVASSGAQASGKTTGRIGDTLHTATFAEDPLRVTLVKVVDPATPTDPNNAAYPGMRWVGLQFTVIVDGPDSMVGSAFVVGSDHQDYGWNTSQSLGRSAGCTATTGTVAQGHPATICPGVMMPTGVQVAEVAFTGLGTETGKGVIYWTLK